MKKLKRVVTTFEYVMVVDDEVDYTEQVIRALRLNKQVAQDLFWEDFDTDVRDLDVNYEELPYGWTKDCIPFGGDTLIDEGYMTIKEIIGD